MSFNLLSKRLFLLLVLITALSSFVQAELKVEGMIKAEIISDPLNFNPGLAKTDPWRSEDQGGNITPGYYVGHFTKLGLALSMNNEVADIYLPLTLGVAPFSPPAPKWQVYLLADDYMTIPYHVRMNADLFAFSLSNSKVGAGKLGFLNMNDQLGVFWRPNSEHPMATFRVDGKLSNDWDGYGYVLFDQEVKGIARWEALPESIANLPLASLTVSDYGFTDEIAVYTFLQAKRETSNYELSLMLGQKYVDNPAFSIKGPETSKTSTILQNWGYLKQNLGLDFKKKLSPLATISGAVVGSEGNWKKYSGADYTIMDSLAGNAAAVDVEFQLPGSKVTVGALAVDPSFQAVAAVNGQFPVINRLVANSSEDLTVQRYVHAIFDPRGRILGEEVVTSPVIDYLGKRAFNVSFESTGKINEYPLNIVLHSEKVSSIAEEVDYVHPLTGALLVKDYRESGFDIGNAAGKNNFHVLGSSRQYLASQDYKRTLALNYERSLANNLILFSSLGKNWRFREDASDGEGSAIEGLITLSKKSADIDLALSADYRSGNYDHDLLRPIADRMVSPYTYLDLRAFGLKEKSFSFRGEKAQATLAGEYISRQSDLEDVGPGNSLVGLFQLDLPWNKGLSSKTTYLGVNGDLERGLPVDFLSTTLHHEFIYKPHLNDDLALHFGYSWRGDNKSAYAALVAQFGPGKFSLSYGQPTVFSSLELDGNYAGALTMENAYVDGYLPASQLRGLPWEKWHNNNFNALYKNRVRSTENTWVNYLVLRYWLDF